MHRRTIREEKVINEVMVKHQETVADLSMVELSQAVSEILRGSGYRKRGGGEGGGGGGATVHFLITAAELHLRLHEWGKKSDANNHNHHAHDGELTHHPNQLR
ncbi:hypothetical protein ACSBR2_009235 [Camellia fascicularis]